MLNAYQSFIAVYKEWIPIVISFSFTMFFDWIYLRTAVLNSAQDENEKTNFSALGMAGLSAGALTFLSMLVVASFQFSRASINTAFFPYIGAYIVENASTWTKFTIPLVANLSLGLMYGAVKKRKRGAKWLGIISAVIALALIVSFAAVPPMPTLIIPANILATSYNTIPVDYLFINDSTYFDDGTYRIPQPFETSVFKPLPTASPVPAEVPDSSAEPSPSSPPEATPEPLIFSELMKAVKSLTEMTEEWQSYLDKAYTVYQSGAIDINDNDWDVAWMYICLGDSDYNGNADEYYLEAANRFIQLNSTWNVGYCYAKLSDYDNALKYYRLAYKSPGSYDEPDRYNLLRRAVNIIENLSGIDKAISEYGTAQSYFNEISIKTEMYFDAGDLYLKKYYDTDNSGDFNKAIAEYEKVRKISGYSYQEELKVVDEVLSAYEVISDPAAELAYLRNELTRKVIKNSPEATAYIYRQLVGREPDESVLPEAKQAVQDTPYFAEFANRLGAMYANQNRYDEASTEFLSVINSEIADVYERQKAIANIGALIESMFFDGKYVEVTEIVPQIPISLETSLLYCESAIRINTIQNDMQHQINQMVEHYQYHPKLMIYCTALSLITRERSLIDDSMSILFSLYNQEQYHIETPYFDAYDIINYTKLLQANGRYKNAHEIVSLALNTDSELVTAHATLIEASSLYFERNMTSSVIKKSEANAMAAKLLSATEYFTNNNSQNSHNAGVLLNLLYGNIVGDEFDYSLLESLIPRDNINNNYVRALLSWKIDTDFSDAIRYCDMAVAAEDANFKGFSKYDILMLRAKVYYDYALSFDKDDTRRETNLMKSQNDYEQILNEISTLYSQASLGLSQIDEALAQIPTPEFPSI